MGEDGARRSWLLVLALVCTVSLLAGCSSSPSPSAVNSAGASPQGCSSRTAPSGGTAALVGGTTPVAEGGYVTDLTAWHRLRPSLRRQFEQELHAAVADSDTSGCVQTASMLRVGVTTPPPVAHPVDDIAESGLPAGCRAGPRGTTECDTLFGFGAGSTPFTVTGQVEYTGTPVCVAFGSGQLCTGWFGAWGADGTTTTGATGSGIGASTLAVATGGDVRAQAVSSPSTLYFSRAPSADQSSVMVTPYVTLLDVTVQSMSDSAQCAPTKIAIGVVTPNVSTPDESAQVPVSCVDEGTFGDRADPAASGSSSYLAVRAAQRALASGVSAPAVMQQLVSAATAIHSTLAATSHAGLFSAGNSPVTSGTVVAAACPVLNDALASGTKTADAFACTQSSITPFRDVVLGQSLVSAQLTATATAESSGLGGEAHLLMAFNTVEVHECWPAANCG